jgi:5-methylcytosine-specific restriction endonuclease McrA
MTEQQKRFIELHYFEKKKYPEIERIMGLSRETIHKLVDDKVKEVIEDIQKIRSKFTEKRKIGFNNDFKAFYEWYISQEQKCGYCGISQDELYEIFKEKHILPYLESDREYQKNPKRSSGTLEIERLDSSVSYNPSNLILACPLCNNAKSNLIDEKSWRDLFVPAMRKYYEKLLNKKLKN